MIHYLQVLLRHQSQLTGHARPRVKQSEIRTRTSSGYPVSGALITFGSGESFPPNIQSSGDNGTRMPNILPENFVVHRSVPTHGITQLCLRSHPTGLSTLEALTRTFFPHPLRLCVDHPCFPYRRDLLSQQGYISSGKSYHLHAWRLSCSTTKQQDFQRRSLSSPQLLGDPLKIECTTTGGYASLTGPQGKYLIHLVPQLLK